MGTAASIQSTTWFDRLPTEIIFTIFDYLSNKDIIYTFLFFSQRLNNLLLRNQHYINHLQLPTKNFDTWKHILSVIGSRIESLDITSIDLPSSLEYFPNLKSIIISTPYGLPNDQMKLIFESKSFAQLDSFKVKENLIYPTQSFLSRSINQDNVLRKVFNNKSELQKFYYPRFIKYAKNNLTSYEINLNLHSLKLILNEFRDIFSLILYTPNLEYLNIRTELSRTCVTPIEKSNIKLKQFHLTLKQPTNYQNNLNELTNGIKQFSSSLTCLSLNLIDCTDIRENEIPFNSVKLQQLLESMIELKQFHLYATLNVYDSSRNILSRFQDQYWFDHKWTFGTHGTYFYTLPFHFEYLHNFCGFDNIKSSNSEVLLTNPRIWYTVKYIDLYYRSTYDINFLKELKMEMPKLIFIKHRSFYKKNKNEKESEDLHVNENEEVKNHITLYNMTTIQFDHGSIENRKKWLINTLPNLNHLILSTIDLPSPDSQSADLLNKRIRRLDINTTNSSLKQLTEISYVYFSNVEHIYFELFYDPQRRSQWYTDIVRKILKNFKSLERLIIRSFPENGNISNAMTRDLTNILECYDMIEIKKNFQMKQFGEWILFSKDGWNDSKVQSGIRSSILRKFKFFKLRKS
ncbi:unnamed protein product [Adineta steineri]|uniref:F-box domain-containing protein n=1 Tax=Adineta steineri TaxID=433720 RepID=A0A813TPQ6_9BILA|nr:unnamed protein product [Adineta steineri]